MRMTRIFKALAVSLFVLMLVGCAAQPPAPVETRSEPQPGVEELVRAPAADEARGLQVFPLRNPAVAELSEAARQAESEGDLDRAAVLLERALRIQARDPELLQQLAEVHLARGAYEQADSYASRSFDQGPRVGEICQRNWRTMALARERMNQSEAARLARERLEQCQVTPPPRL